MNKEETNSEIISHLKTQQDEYKYGSDAYNVLRKLETTIPNIINEQGEKTELQKVMDELSEWQDKTFPSVTSFSKLHHLKQEVVELINEKSISSTLYPKNILVRREYADCFMLLLGATIKDGFTANNIIQIIREKHEINKKRKWGKPDKNGVIKHI